MNQAKRKYSYCTCGTILISDNEKRLKKCLDCQIEPPKTNWGFILLCVILAVTALAFFVVGYNK